MKQEKQARGAVPYDDGGEIETKAIGKVLTRLVPFTIVLYVFNYLDRVNLSFAKLQMNGELGFSDAVFGFGASIFFIGYLIFEVPSNLIQQRVGARIWIARIMITWGGVSGAMAFIKGERSFYILRFLLGIAEAGFFPGILYFYTQWVPKRHRAGIGSVFLTSLAIAGICGGPTAGILLKTKGWGLVGWQWLFLLEGIPTIMLGFLVLLVLPNSPAEAKWLSQAERSALASALNAEKAELPRNSHTLKYALVNPILWLLSLQYGFMLFAFYALSYWTPSIIQHASKASSGIVGWLSAIPFAAAMLAMVFIGYLTDRFAWKRGVVAVSALVGAAGLFSCALSVSTTLVIISLSVAAMGIYGMLAPFWTIPPTLLGGTAMAAGIAMINSVGNLGGGFIGPNVIGQLRERYHSYQPSLFVSAGALVIVALIVGGLRPRRESFATGSALNPNR